MRRVDVPLTVLVFSLQVIDCFSLSSLLLFLLHAFPFPAPYDGLPFFHAACECFGRQGCQGIFYESGSAVGVVPAFHPPTLHLLFFLLLVPPRNSFFLSVEMTCLWTKKTKIFLARTTLERWPSPFFLVQPSLVNRFSLWHSRSLHPMSMAALARAS